MLARNGDVPLRQLATQTQLSRIRNVLRDAESDVGKITIRKSGERPRAADRELLHHNFRVRKRRSLRGDLGRTLPAVARCQNLGVMALRFFDQISERSGQAGVGFPYLGRIGFQEDLSPRG